MAIVDAARSRYTTKAFDPAKKISAKEVSELCELTRLSASSTNAQPWHFVLAATDEGKATIAKATQGNYSFNEAKVLNASHVMVLCSLTEVTDEHLWQATEQESVDGRYPSEEVKLDAYEKRRYFRDLHRNAGAELEAAWAAKQAYLALGSLLLGAGAMGIDACPIEGFDVDVLNEVLGLKEKGLCAQVIVALGYRDESDFNAKLPKSRFEHDAVFTEI